MIDKGQFHMLSSDLLRCRSQLAHLFAILLRGWLDMQCQQIAQGLDRDRHFAASASPGPIMADSWPLSGLACKVRLSKVAAEYRALRPGARRNTARKSLTTASKTPAFSQRWVC